MIWVFRTTVDTKEKVARVSQFMNLTIGAGFWYLDLGDLENVLRIETGSQVKIEKVKMFFQTLNFEIVEMSLFILIWIARGRAKHLPDRKKSLPFILSPSYLLIL